MEKFPVDVADGPLEKGGQFFICKSNHVLLVGCADEILHDTNGDWFVRSHSSNTFYPCNDVWASREKATRHLIAELENEREDITRRLATINERLESLNNPPENPAPAEPVSPGIKVPANAGYIGWYSCGDKIGPVDGRLLLNCPQHKEDVLVCAIVSDRPVECTQHGVQATAYSITDGVVDQTIRCSHCAFEQNPVVKEKHRQKQWADRSENLKQKITCPLGKEPCAMHQPDCNISPGLFRVDFQGQQRDMCGDCVNECGAHVLATAKSIDRPTVQVREGDGDFRGQDRKARQ